MIKILPYLPIGIFLIVVAIFAAFATGRVIEIEQAKAQEAYTPTNCHEEKLEHSRCVVCVTPKDSDISCQWMSW